MNNLSILIVDDEPIAQNILELYCQKLSTVTVVAKCKNALEAFHMLKQHSIDLIFLDINMPEISGIDFIKSLPQPMPYIIFTTAYSEFAVVSYELNALDYLVKPISFERFLTGINKAFDLKQAALRQAKAMDSDIELMEKDSSIFVRSDGKFIRIDLNELLYIEGLKDYVKFCFLDKKIVVHGTLKKTEEFLLSKSKLFLRVHKSYIINISKIVEFSADSIKLNINNLSVPLGQTYTKDLEKIISDRRY